MQNKKVVNNELQLAIKQLNDYGIKHKLVEKSSKLIHLSNSNTNEHPYCQIPLHH